MAKKDSLVKQVISEVSGGPLMQDIYAAQGLTLDNFMADQEDLFNQLFVETATWGLKYWEEFCGIQTDLEKDDNLRKAAIRTHLMGTGTVTKKVIQRVSADFGFNSVEVAEDYAPYIVKLVFDNSGAAKQANASEVLRALRELFPAHVDMFYIFLNNSWQEIQEALMIYDTLDTYQWRDFSENNDVALNQSPNLGLNLWSDGDILSMGGMNSNFNKIDNKFGAKSGHSHNDIDGHKIDANSETKYVVTEMGVTNVAEAISRVVNKIGTAGGKEQLKAIIGGDALSESSWNLVLYWLLKSKENIAAAITAKGVAASTSDTMSVLNQKINQIDIGIPPQGTAEPDEVKEGKTFINSTGIKTGTAKVHEASKVFTPSISSIDLSGIHDGSTKVKGAPGLTGGNIKGGISLWGVNGSYNDSDYHEGDIIPKEKVSIWSTSTDSRVWTYADTGLRAIANDRAGSNLFVGGTPLVRLTQNGDFFWKRPNYSINGQVFTIEQMIIDNHEIYAVLRSSLKDMVVKLDPVTGDYIWGIDFTAYLVGGIMAHNDKIYVNCKTKIAVHNLDGTFNRDIQLADAGYMLNYSGEVIPGDMAMCITNAGFLYYVETNCLGPSHTYTSGIANFSHYPIGEINHNSLESAPIDSKLVKVDLSNDSVVWKKDLTDSIYKRVGTFVTAINEDEVVVACRGFIHNSESVWNGSVHVNVVGVRFPSFILKYSSTGDKVYDEKYGIWMRMSWLGETRELAEARVHGDESIIAMKQRPTNTLAIIGGVHNMASQPHGSNMFGIDANINRIATTTPNADTDAFAIDNDGSYFYIETAKTLAKSGQRISTYKISY